MRKKKLGEFFSLLPSEQKEHLAYVALLVAEGQGPNKAQVDEIIEGCPDKFRDNFRKLLSKLLESREEVRPAISRRVIEVGKLQLRKLRRKRLGLEVVKKRPRRKGKRGKK